MVKTRAGELAPNYIPTTHNRATRITTWVFIDLLNNYDFLYKAKLCHIHRCLRGYGKVERR
jgi:hypothetical protein